MNRKTENEEKTAYKPAEREKIAHKRDDGTTQSIPAHLKGVAHYMPAFTESFPKGVAEQALEMAMVHDIGKYSISFQRRIWDGIGHPDHSTAGAQELWHQGMIPGAFCVAGHHGGLPDGGNWLDNASVPTFYGRMGKRLDDYSDWKKDIELHTAPLPSTGNHFDDAFLTRMLFSCLVDADYLDTEAFMRPDVVRPTYDSLDSLLDKLQNHIARWYPPKSALNEKRCEILDACIGAGKSARGIFNLTVPTGGGKTVSSLAFALHHAKAHGLKRIIYVIPYISIIEQTADNFREIVGDGNVLECHANIGFDPKGDDHPEEDPRTERLRLSAENFDAPLIVTTSVQFFESLFSNRPSRCRKLHNLANSVIIFDEAQMLPLPYLLPCVRAIETLVKQYGSTAVLCTATQPSLEKFFSSSMQPREICPDIRGLYDFFRRVNFQDIGKVTLSDLAERMVSRSQALTIVNTRRQAAALYSLLPKDGRFHLSTLMIPADRRRVLAKIRQRLEDGLPCWVAATSMVEAGVDVDFPVVFREEAGADNIIQAGGRCNREGKRDRADSIVFIFQLDDKPPRIIEQNTKIFREIKRNHPDLAAPDTIAAYFDALHDLKGSDLDKKGVIKAFESGIEGRLMPFSTIAKEFRLIETDTCSVLIPLDEESRKYAAALRAGTITRSELRKAGQYMVELYPNQFAQLQKMGCIEPVKEDLAILTDMKLYDPNIGLKVDPPEGQAIIF